MSVTTLLIILIAVNLWNALVNTATFLKTLDVLSAEEAPENMCGVRGDGDELEGESMSSMWGERIPTEAERQLEDKPSGWWGG